MDTLLFSIRFATAPSLLFLIIGSALRFRGLVSSWERTLSVVIFFSPPPLHLEFDMGLFSTILALLNCYYHQIKPPTSPT